MIRKLYIEENRSHFEVAEILGMSPRMLFVRLKQYGLSKTGKEEKRRFCPGCGRLEQ